MTYNSKKTLVSIIGGLLLLIAYVVYALGGAAPALDDMKSWALVMLVFIGISVAAMIVIQILFHIAVAVGVTVREKTSDDKHVGRIVSSMMVEDERDKLISLKSARIGYACMGIGFVAALVFLACGFSGFIALHTVFGACFLGSTVEGLIGIYHNERGVLNG